MDVRDIMTPDPVTVSPDVSLDRAVHAMDEYHVRHLPVLDHEGGALLGLISDRDLLAAIGWHPALSSAEESHPGVVRDIMHTALTKVAPDDTVVMAAVDLVLQTIGCLPVIEDGRLVGILSEMDMLRAFVVEADAERLPMDDDPPIAEHMSERLLTVSPTTPIAEAVELCHLRHVRHLPVVEGDRLVGIVSDRDLRGALGSQRPEAMPVETIMSPEALIVAPDAHLSHAAELMHTYKFGALPVVEDHKLIGIVSVTNVLDHCMNTLREPESRSEQ
jgi:acetoin utilization protein AcuB